MTKPKKRRRKPPRIGPPRMMVLAWVKPEIWKQLKRLTTVVLRKDPECDPGDVAGYLLDAMVPIVSAEVRKKERETYGKKRREYSELRKALR